MLAPTINRVPPTSQVNTRPVICTHRAEPRRGTEPIEEEELHPMAPEGEPQCERGPLGPGCALTLDACDDEPRSPTRRSITLSGGRPIGIGLPHAKCHEGWFAGLKGYCKENAFRHPIRPEVQRHTPSTVAGDVTERTRTPQPAR